MLPYSFSYQQSSDPKWDMNEGLMEEIKASETSYFATLFQVTMAELGVE